MPQTTIKYDVFLSHSSKDKKTVIELAERLKKDDLKVWLDDWIVYITSYTTLVIWTFALGMVMEAR